MLLLLEDIMNQQLLKEDFRMLQVVSTGTVYPPVVTTGGFLLLGHTSRQQEHCALHRHKEKDKAKLDD